MTTRTGDALISIKTQNNTQVVDARELHSFLEVKSDFNNWIKNRIDDYGFVENQDFEVIVKNYENSTGGRPSKEYAISLDMAKELAMVERNEKGKIARRYFIEVEKSYYMQPTIKEKTPTNAVDNMLFNIVQVRNVNDRVRLFEAFSQLKNNSIDKSIAVKNNTIDAMSVIILQAEASRIRKKKTFNRTLKERKTLELAIAKGI